MREQEFLTGQDGPEEILDALPGGLLQVQSRDQPGDFRPGGPPRKSRLVDTLHQFGSRELQFQQPVDGAPFRPQLPVQRPPLIKWRTWATLASPLRSSAPEVSRGGRPKESRKYDSTWVSGSWRARVPRG